MNISFIGYGNMAKAIVNGLRSNKAYELRASSPSLPSGTDKNGTQTCSDNLAVIHDADVLILAVKPANMNTVVAQIDTSKLPADCVIISVASGLNLSWFEKHLPKTAIIRAMPNVASALGQGATPLVANKFVTKKQQQTAEIIFTNLGLVTWVQNENDINAFTALSGSGPAYVFMFMEAMIKAAVALGIAEDVAKSFALQTFKGALGLATETELTLSELRKTVTSPAGTTAAAIEVLNQHGFDAMIDKAMRAACERARQQGEKI